MATSKQVGTLTVREGTQVVSLKNMLYGYKLYQEDVTQWAARMKFEYDSEKSLIVISPETLVTDLLKELSEWGFVKIQ